MRYEPRFSDSERAKLRFDLVRAAPLAAAIAGVAAIALLRWADWGSGKRPTGQGAAEVAVWEALLVGQVVVWTVLAVAGLRALRQLDAHGDASFPETERWLVRWRAGAFLVLVYGATLLLLVAGGTDRLRNPYVIPGQAWKLPLLHVVAGLATAPFFVVLKRVQLAAVDAARWSTTAADIARISRLRRQTRSATAALGAIIALAVVATGALRQAVDAAGRMPLPESSVILYGAWFTGVLAAVYLYVSTALQARARSMLETAAPLPDPNVEAADAFVAAMTLRRELSSELGLGADPRKDLEELLVVLSPLLGSLLTQVGGL